MTLQETEVQLDIGPQKSPGLSAQNVAFAHGNTTVLADIDFNIEEGEFVSLLGPSGCGKTTLLRLLAGLELPASGQLSWKGQPITGPSLERGVVFQDYSLFPWMTLRKNVSTAIAKSHPEMEKRWRLDLANQYIEMVGLTEAAARYPFELSGGMQQRGAIARTLALGSPVLLMDEPFGALDPVNRARLQDLALHVWAGATPRRTVVFVTHDIDEALYLSTRILMLGAAPGRIIDEIDIPFALTRARADVFESEQFQELRARISARFRQDFIRQYESSSTVNHAAGI
jgi:NitT/TauT family transport system ATP-binding protein